MKIEDRIAILEKKVEILELESRFDDKHFFLLLSLYNNLKVLLDERSGEVDRCVEAGQQIAKLQSELEELENGQL